ncbi:hypothetical protein CHS0354_006083 [Potamilus streckersoni]|uniref:Uncharacterized protein n=1 Tax=Potamilus streckersoni TaxID=2493646 RepID=A0AAE0STH2_9BIVA|nr:hypothetical protein CHS0354_006083 [Potamilus streckersoni]
MSDYDAADSVSTESKKTSKEEPEYITTAMADFRRHENIERRKPCYPVVNDHFFHDKFDSQTSYALTYKPHNITIPEKPLWGRKPVYKHPQGGMILESRYMKDYTDPKVIHPVAPIRPPAGMKNISGDGDIQMQPYTTYSLNYQEWKNARPATLCPQDFKLYEPPTEKMICESTQKEHFKGEYMIPRQPCRHISEHRLDDQVKRPMYFNTSYQENFKVPERPKSGPTAAEEGRKFRIKSRAWRANI